MASGNWWSTFEPLFFQRLVDIYKDVVVFLLQMHKMGIPPAEQRIFTCFVDTSLRFLEILHKVREGLVTGSPAAGFSLLSLCCSLKVNEKSGSIIQYDKFYIHELDDLIDIRNDYVTWIQRQMYPMVSQRGSILTLEVFTPCY